MRLGLASAALLCALVGIGWAAPQDEPTIYILNRSSLVSNEQITKALPAFQEQIDENLGPAWNVSGHLVFAGDAPAGSWRIVITDDPACFFCGGFHEYRAGMVRAEVAATSDREWQVSFSHELVEMLVDPYIHSDGDGGRLALDGKKAWLVEVGDPVEDTRFAYERDGTLLSDFTLPAWYSHGSHGPWDFRGHCLHAGHMLPGGYQWFIRQGQWVQL